MIKLIIYFLASIGVLASSAISPAMGRIYLYFDTVDPTIVKLILTTTSLFVIPASMFSVYLCKKIGKKKTLLIALLIYGIVGCCTGLFSNIYIIIACRALLGCGVGLLMPISQSLPVYFFNDKERENVMTRQSASISMGNMVFVLISGWLALISWRLSFCVYVLAIPVFIIVYFFLPDFDDRPAQEKTEEEKAKEKEPLPLKAFIIALSICLFMIAMFAFYSSLGIFVQIREIGTPATVAYVLAVGNLTSFMTSQNSMRIRSFLGMFFIPSVCFMMTIGYTVIYFTHTSFGMFIGGMCAAYSMGCIMPTTMIAMANTVSKEQIIRAMAVMSTAMFFGQFCSPIAMNFLPAFPGFNEYGANFLTLSFLFLLVGIGLSFYTAYAKNKKCPKT